MRHPHGLVRGKQQPSRQGVGTTCLCARSKMTRFSPGKLGGRVGGGGKRHHGGRLGQGETYHKKKWMQSFGGGGGGGGGRSQCKTCARSICKGWAAQGVFASQIVWCSVFVPSQSRDASLFNNSSHPNPTHPTTPLVAFLWPGMSLPRPPLPSLPPACPTRARALCHSRGWQFPSPPTSSASGVARDFCSSRAPHSCASLHPQGHAPSFPPSLPTTTERRLGWCSGHAAVVLLCGRLPWSGLFLGLWLPPPFPSLPVV